MQKQKIEILAPAGDFDMLRAAVFSGADCVYVGVDGFNARGGAANFGEKELAEAVAFCHARGCGVHAALNTLALPEEAEKLDEAILSIANAGCDAVIVQDLGVAARVRALVPDLQMNASTQLSVHSIEGVRQLANMGFKQAILARELSRKELEYIAEKTPIALEVFVHGALCVSVSGQCWMSVFLGGRSANRGTCAGTCRLPFAAECGDCGGENAEANHLSLKDLSIIDSLLYLQEIGIKTAKIEGRLRGPEYVAASVDAARKVLAGENYDADFLRDIYSRSGFTSGWYSGTITEEMFGVRTPQDSAASKAALPKARQLYRREMPRIGVNFKLVLSENKVNLRLTDGENTLEITEKFAMEKSKNDNLAMLEASLGKTGGTPFYLENAEVNTNGFFVPQQVVSKMRGNILAQLLEIRGKSKPFKINKVERVKNTTPTNPRGGRPAPVRIVARFENMDNLPIDLPDLCDEMVLPLFSVGRIQQDWQSKTRLHLPRIMFGKEEKTACELVASLNSEKFVGYEAGNIAHLSICKGGNVSTGFSMNTTNIDAMQELVRLGCTGVTLSPELTLKQADVLCATFPKGKQRTALLAYGFLPLMTTRACPIQNVKDCVRCEKTGVLHDRKNITFKINCDGQMRYIYNSVPLWLADKKSIWPADDMVLYFTSETAQQVRKILYDFKMGNSPNGAITRGLYERGLKGKE